MNIQDKMVSILMESFLNEGLMRRQRVAAAMNRKLQGNQSQVNPDDPNLQEPGANTPQGKEIYTPSERQSANARVAQFHKGAASAEARRGERIRQRIVHGGKGLKTMAAGVHRGERISPEQKAANKEVGGVAKTSPMDVLRRSRELQAKSQQQGGNASNVARGIRHNARNLAREKRGLPLKSRYSSRAPVGERLPESVIMTYDRILNILLEARVESYIERLDEKTRYQKEIEKGNLSNNAVRRLRRAELKGKLDEPKPEYFSGGRITRIQRLKKEAAEGKKRKAKGKSYNIPKVDTKPRELPQGPGKQTGPLEKRGIKVGGK